MVSLAPTSNVTVLPVSVLMKICMQPPPLEDLASLTILASSCLAGSPPAARMESSLATRWSSTLIQSSSVLLRTCPKVCRVTPESASALLMRKAPCSREDEMRTTSCSSLGRSRRYMHFHSSHLSMYDTLQVPGVEPSCAPAAAEARIEITSRLSLRGAGGLGILSASELMRAFSSSCCIVGSVSCTEEMSAKGILEMAPFSKRWIAEKYSSVASWQPCTTFVAFSITSSLPLRPCCGLPAESPREMETSAPLQDSSRSPKLVWSKG
mmetsp:Transcript_40053/g.64770  ORF Transcript_40053/g.64770 Transcript_40053/m.64770 type:complete len:267 (+) Transcript_40053:782-1582(+)